MPAEPDHDDHASPETPRNLLFGLVPVGGFRGAVLTLLSGTTITAILGYVIQPVLTRLYPADAFGLFDAFISVFSVLVPFASFRYEDALMLPEDDRDAAQVWWLSLALILALTVLTGILTVWRTEFAVWLSAPDLASWLLLLPATLLVMRSAKLAELWLVRRKRFRSITAGQVVRSLVRSGGQVAGGLPPFTPGAGGLLGGFFIGQAASAGVFLYAMFRESRQALSAAFKRLRLRRTARRYRRFALYSTPSTLLNTLLVHLPVLLILPFFGEETVGYYGRALLGLAVPMNLIGVAVGQVFFVHAAEAHRAGTLDRLSDTVHARLVAVGLYPTLALLLAGPDVFGFVFGGEWRVSGDYVRYLGPWLMLAGIASPLTRLFDILEHQRLDLLMSVILFTIQTAALVVGCLTGDIYRALLFLGVAGAFARVLHIGVVLRLGGLKNRQILRPYARYALLSLPCLLPVLAALTLQRPFASTLAVAAGFACYGALVAWRDGLVGGP